MQHWKQHKSECTFIKEKYDDWKKDMSESLPDSTALDTKEGPCAICLEETITNPVNLPCGHVFCFECVGKYQHASESDEAASCPYCRGEIPNMLGRASERAFLYRNRAFAASNGSADEKKYAKLAIAEVDSVDGMFSSGDEAQNIKHTAYALYLKGSMSALADQPNETIKITKELLSFNEAHPGVLKEQEVDFTIQRQAEAYAALGKWKESARIYSSLSMSLLQRGFRPSVEMMMGLSRAAYEMQDYDKAIKSGNLAIKYTRQVPGVHKYLALTQKAKGDIDGAKKTISRAILYEMHWDKDNLRQNKQLLRELNEI